MNRFQHMIARTHLATIGFFAGVVGAPEDRESGQSSAEYAGIVIVAVVLVGVLIGAANDWGTSIKDLITEKIDSLG